MKNTHQIKNSWYFKKIASAPIWSDADQTQALASFAAAKRALRDHLHACRGVTQHIISCAKAAASGAKGTKNETKRLFKTPPSREQVNDCSTAVESEAISRALHALDGKQALYWECVTMAEKAPSPRTGTPDAYTRELRARKSTYLRAREVLVNNNLRLAASVVGKVGATSMEFDDLMQHAAIGIQKAVEGFNPSQAKFSTYAVPVVRGEIIRALENYSRTVKLPSHVWTTMRKYDEVQQALSSALGRPATPSEIALEMGITTREAVQIQQYHCEQPISLQSPIGSDGESNFGDTLIDHNAQIPGDESWEYAA